MGTSASSGSRYLATKLDDRNELLRLPGVGGRNLDCAEVGEQAIDLAALRGQKDRGRALIAAHDIEIEPQGLFGHEREDQIGRA